MSGDTQAQTETYMTRKSCQIFYPWQMLGSSKLDSITQCHTTMTNAEMGTSPRLPFVLLNLLLVLCSQDETAMSLSTGAASYGFGKWLHISICRYDFQHQRTCLVQKGSLSGHYFVKGCFDIPYSITTRFSVCQMS